MVKYIVPDAKKDPYPSPGVCIEIFDTGVINFYFLSVQFGTDHRFLPIHDKRCITYEVRGNGKTQQRRFDHDVQDLHRQQREIRS